MSSFGPTGPIIVICGNGASAVALLHALAACSLIPLTIFVIGAGKRGAGLAYGTDNPSHLLNTPAGRMSIDPDEPEQFVEWLRKHDLWRADWESQFVPRQYYGRYLREAAALATLAPGLAIHFLQEDVISLTRFQARSQTNWRVAYAGGQIDADFVVLATGNDMPSPLAPRLAPALRASVVDNPWELPPIREDERVLVLGTGLTAVDTVLSLADRGHRGEIVLLSRHGLLPHTHVRLRPHAPLTEPYPKTALSVLQALRLAAGHRDTARWQGVMDAMRPHWHEVWQGLPLAEQRRFLRHGATIWNMHRHRVAPQVARRLQQVLGRNGRVIKGRITSIEADGDSAALIAISGGRRLTADRIVNCLGPNSDPEKSHNRLIENVVASLQARTAPSGIGLDVTHDDRVIGHDGQAHASLFAMGSLTRGRWWEITGLPEIVLQARDIARRLQARALAKSRTA